MPGIERSGATIGFAGNSAAVGATEFGLPASSQTAC
jgi:hypothetical protein